MIMRRVISIVVKFGAVLMKYIVPPDEEAKETFFLGLL